MASLKFLKIFFSILHGMEHKKYISSVETLLFHLQLFPIYYACFLLVSCFNLSKSFNFFSPKS